MGWLTCGTPRQLLPAILAPQILCHPLPGSCHKLLLSLSVVTPSGSLLRGPPFSSAATYCGSGAYSCLSGNTSSPCAVSLVLPFMELRRRPPRPSSILAVDPTSCPQHLRTDRCFVPSRDAISASWCSDTAERPCLVQLGLRFPPHSRSCKCPRQLVVRQSRTRSPPASQPLVLPDASFLQQFLGPTQC